MKRSRQRGSRQRLPALVGFLEAVYRFENDEQTWLSEVSETIRLIWGGHGWVQAAIYDASNVHSFVLKHMHMIGAPEEAIAKLAEGLSLFTPEFVARTFRTAVAGLQLPRALPEMAELHSSMSALGYVNPVAINGLDPSGISAFVSLWGADAPHDSEMALYRRIAHHLGAAYRCRRRIQQTQANAITIDPIDDAEAVFDARGRVLHATGTCNRKALTSKPDRNLASSRSCPHIRPG